MNTLLTIPASHFCEKARWALDRAGIPYVEEGHAPMLHWSATARFRARTVPLLVTSGAVLRSSGEILRWVDARSVAGQQLYPNDPAARREVEELEAHFDARLGSAARRLAYFHVLPERELALALLGPGIPLAERALLTSGWPALRRLMARGMGIHAAGALRARERLRAVFGEVSARLADGRRYLVGDRFSAADLTFAALATPMLAPPEFERLPAWDALLPSMRAEVSAFRDTPAGQWALALYRQERRAPRSDVG